MDKAEQQQELLPATPTSMKDFPKHKENPFVKSLAEYKVAKKRTVIKGGKAIIDTETGQYEDTAEITTTRSVDAEKFVKLYTVRLKDLFGLKPASMKVLQVLLHQIQETAIDRDTVMLNYKIAERYFTENGLDTMAKSTFYTALAEMVSKGFIAQADVATSLFFINPSIFFNGDRVKFVEEWHIQRNPDLFLQNRTVEQRALGPKPPSNQIDIEDYINGKSGDV